MKHKIILKELYKYLDIMSLSDFKVGDTIEIVAEKTGSDIVRELLTYGKSIIAYVSNNSQAYADTGFTIIEVTGFTTAFVTSGGNKYTYASPVDTGKFAQYIPEVKK